MINLLCIFGKKLFNIYLKDLSIIINYYNLIKNSENFVKFYKTIINKKLIFYLTTMIYFK